MPDENYPRMFTERYRLTRELGRGMTGVVHQAIQIAVNRTVAIKVLNEQFCADRHFLRRFEIEARVQALLDSPHAVWVYDFGQDRRGVPFIVMEYVDGVPLTTPLARLGRFPLLRALRILQQVCAALDQAHKRGIVHRDIKPANVLLLNHSPHDHVKVVDFSIARIPEGNGTLQGVILGTPPYMSPEQISSGKPVDSRADVYGCGVLFYELVTGKPPFESDNLPDLLHQTIATEPKIPSFVPSSVAKVILRSLSKRPQDRQSDAAALLADLEMLWEEHAPVEQTNGSGPRRISSSLRQRTSGFVRTDSLSHELPPGARAFAISPSGAIAIGGLAEVRLIDLDKKEIAASAPLGALARPLAGLRFSPNDRWLAAYGDEGGVCFYEARTLALEFEKEGRISTGETGAYALPPGQGSLRSLPSAAWSPDGRLIAICVAGHFLYLHWVRDRRSIRCTLPVVAPISAIAFHPIDGQLATGGIDGAIRIFQLEGDKAPLQVQSLQWDNVPILELAWSPDGRTLAAACHDGTVRLWESEIGSQRLILEGHRGPVSRLAFAPDGRLLATVDEESNLRLWRCDPCEAIIEQREALAAFSFHPTEAKFLTLHAACLETIGDKRVLKEQRLDLWRYEAAVVLLLKPIDDVVHYSNAKVLLLGETGVGKTALSLVLRLHNYKETDSTHGRQVLDFDSERIEVDGVNERREVLLWDLAGQRIYGPLHQLHLGKTSVALIVFDDRPESFGSLRYWDRALRQAEARQSDGRPIRKILVAARCDYGSVGISEERLLQLRQQCGALAYFITSAKTGRQILDLRSCILSSIDWDRMPKVQSTELFRRIKAHLLQRKLRGMPLISQEALFRSFLASPDAPAGSREELRKQFATCLQLVENVGLLRKLSIGDRVLLQPDLLDIYAAAVIHAARDESDGLGSIPISDVLEGRFRMEAGERIANSEAEQILLAAMVQDLLFHEVALRESTEDGDLLVFPGQLKRDFPEYEPLHGRDIIFSFEGAIHSIYATLVVRLSRSGFFIKSEMWHNAAVFRSTLNGTCGLRLREPEEGRGELILFSSSEAGVETRAYFADYVRRQLERRAVPGTIKSRRVPRCPVDGDVFSDDTIKVATHRGMPALPCPLCQSPVPLTSETIPWAETSGVMQKMDREADKRRDLEVLNTAQQGQSLIQHYDIFLAYHPGDRIAAEQIGTGLRRLGLSVWLNQAHQQPSTWFSEIMQSAICDARSVVFLIGRDGVGYWSSQDLDEFTERCVQADLPVVSVLLPGVSRLPGALPRAAQRAPIRCPGLIDESVIVEIKRRCVDEEERRPLQIYVSYAAEDEGMWRELSRCLAPLRANRLIEISDPQHIPPGEDDPTWRATRIKTAGIVLLLLSSDYLSSRAREEERRWAAQRGKEEGIPVIPVILRPCAWEQTLLRLLRPLPYSRRAVSQFDRRDDAWQEVVDGIWQMITGEASAGR